MPSITPFPTPTMSPAAAVPGEPYTVLATVGSSSRSGMTTTPSTLVLASTPDELIPVQSDLDTAIAAAQAATKGPYKGALAITRAADGLHAQPVLDLPTGEQFAFETSRSAKTFIHDRMDVRDTDVLAVVDGRRVERLPDYSQATPDAWQDRPLLTLTRQQPYSQPDFQGMVFSEQRNIARHGATHFTPTGTDFDATIKRAHASVKRDYNHDALAILQASDGTYYMTGIQQGYGLLEKGDNGELPPVLAAGPLAPGVVALVGSEELLDLRSVAQGQSVAAPGR